MSRIYQNGAEIQIIDELNIAATMWGDEVNVSTVQKTGGGAASYKFACTQALHSDWTQAYYISTATNATTLFYKTDVYVATMTSSSTASTRFAPIALYGANFLAEVQLYNNSGTLYVRAAYNNGATITSGVSTGIALGNWLRLEAAFDSSPADGSETFEVKVNGATLITTTNLTFASKSVAYYGMRAFAPGSGVGDVTVYVDNISANDANGSTNNTWIGEEYIVALKPDGAGDSNPVIGTYGTVAEIPFTKTFVTVGGDYAVFGTTTNTAIFNVESPITYMSTTDKVNAISVMSMMKNNSAGDYRTALQSASGGTQANSGYYSYNTGNVARLTPHGNTVLGGAYFFESDPTTGGRMKVTGTNSLTNAQIGLNGGGSVAAVAALVAFTPYTPPASHGMMIMFW